MLLTQFNLRKENQMSKSVNLTKLPKAELHVHAEGGTLSPQKLSELANKYNLPVPELIFGENNYLRFSDHDFLDFLKTYDLAASYILTAQDIEDIAYEYLAHCAEMGAIYVEMTCSPDHVAQNRRTYSDVHEELNFESKADPKVAFKAKLTPLLQNHYKSLPNVDYQGFIDAVARGIDRAKADFGIEARILIVLLRHNGDVECHQTLDDVLNYPHPYVVGINLAGDEVQFPPQVFEAHYQRARAAGLKCTAHVGEHTGAEFIRDAVEKLQLDRIGHAVSAISDPELIALIKKRRIGIEANITSNLALTDIHDIAAHPFNEYLEADLLVSLNTDDPTYFGTDLAREYQIAQKAWKLSDQQLLKITRNAIESAFCESSLKEKLYQTIALYEAAQNFKELVEAAQQPQLQTTFAQFMQNPSVSLFSQCKQCMPKDDAIIRDAFDALSQQYTRYLTAESNHTESLQCCQQANVKVVRNTV